MASTPSLASISTPLHLTPSKAQGQEALSLPMQWLHSLIELPEAREWMRVRLELALFDVKERRLNGLIGQYRMFQHLGDAALPPGVCEGYRELGTLLIEAGCAEMGKQAMEVADLLEAWLENGISQDDVISSGTGLASRTSENRHVKSL